MIFYLPVIHLIYSLINFAMNTKKFIDLAKAQHEEKYNYSKVTYTNSPTLYHIHVSCICSDCFWEQSWQEGYYSLILTSDVNEVIDVTNKMNDQLSGNYQAVIAIVKVNNKDDDHVTLQQLYMGYPNISLEDLCFTEPDTEMDKYSIFHDSCYRDDTKEASENSDNDSDDIPDLIDEKDDIIEIEV